ncbi:hypothetical protein [Lysobacter humi (ex Lee et al. 2017)]
MAGLLTACMVLAPVPADARAAQARIARIVSPVGTMDGVRVDLDWPEGARQGALRLRASRVDAPDLGYRFASLDWRCTLRRRDWSTWRCSGPVRAANGAAMQLDVDIDARGLGARLVRGGSRIEVTRRGEPTDVTRIDLTAIPLAWMRTLLGRAWPEAQLKEGQGDARLAVRATRGGLHIAGPVDLRGVGFDTPDGRIAAEGLDAGFDLDLLLGDTDRVRLAGRIGGGEALFGTAYVALPDRRPAFAIEAEQRGACCWRIPRFDWRDGAALAANGSIGFGPGGAVDALDVTLRSDDLAAARDAYLAGALGGAGLADLRMAGGFDARLRLAGGRLSQAEATLRDVVLDDPSGRFAFQGLGGDVRFSADVPVTSDLGWSAGRLYGIDFGPTRIPLESAAGALRIEDAVDVPMLGGRLRFDRLALRPPSATGPAEAEFALDVAGLDLAQLAKTFGLPAFGGTLGGRIPNARYRGNRLDFDGGLALDVFRGRVEVSSLSMERPFGVAPTVSADIVLDDLDLEMLTGTLGFGTITGRLDGRIAGLRLVDWQATTFDARLRTDRHRGVRQRISQRAVQDLSSVGDASFVSSLQNRVIGLFDDFAYSRIGISCRLVDQVCDMDGLRPAGTGFVIVEGGGIPWLRVVGFNRRVDWPTLVERLVAVGKGDAKPVVD